MATVKQDIMEAFYASRKLPEGSLKTACYAPFSSLYFNTNGDVLACCQNVRFPLGNVERQTLDEIWRGPRTAAMRKALMKDNFAAGCQFCQWQFSVGNFVNSFTRNFDRYPVTTPTPEWPQLMEFAVSNTCNLECVMCYGFLSSSIRANREKLPPMAKSYGERFFGELRSYLPHLTYCKFLGGEPFLAAESFRIWDLMREDGLETPCHVTTNGTQYNARVERILERQPVDLAVSLDAATKETFESIRINAKFDEVHRNFFRFKEYTRSRGRSLSVTHCLMRQNWQEFGKLLLFADEHECPVYVNLVREPPDCTLYTLPLEELAKIVRAMEREGESVRDQLGLNRGVWDETLADLRRRVEHDDESSIEPFDTPYALVLHVRVEDYAPPEERFGYEQARAALEAWSPGAALCSLATDADERVTAFGPETETFFGLGLGQCKRREFVQVIEQLGELYGPLRHTVVCKWSRFVDRIFEFALPDGGVRQIRLFSWPTFNEFGTPMGAEVLAAAADISAAAAASLLDAAVQLGHWAQGRPILTLQTDCHDTVTLVEGALEQQVFAPDDALGQWPEDMIPGASKTRSVIEMARRPGYEDRLYHWIDRGQSPLRLRAMKIARFDERQQMQGWTWLVATARCTAEGARTSQLNAQQTLDHWSPEGAQARLEFDVHDRFVKADGEMYCGIPWADLRGKSAEEVGAAFDAALGQPQISDWRRTAEAEDITLRYETDDGPLFMRRIVAPRFDDAGKYVGTLDQRATMLIDRTGAEAAAQQALAPWGPWDSQARRLEFQIDLHERITSHTPLPPTWDVPLMGKSLTELGQAFAESWGPPTVLYHYEAKHFSEHVFEFPKGGGRVLRSLRCPWFDATGKYKGGRVYLAYVPLQADDDAAADRRLEAMLDAPGVVDRRLTLDIDGQGNIASVTGLDGIAGLSGVKSSELVGQFWRAALGHLGQKLAGASGCETWITWNPAVTEVNWRYKSVRADVFVRSLRRPRWDPTGNITRGRVRVAIHCTVHDRSASSLAEVRQRLAEWSPGGPQAVLELNAYDVIERVEAGARGFCGADLSAAVGQRLEFVAAKLAERLGTTESLGEVTPVDEADSTVAFANERGPLMVRSVTFSKFDSNDAYAGAVRVLAALQVTAESTAAAVRLAQDAWPAADDKTLRLELLTDRIGRITGELPTSVAAIAGVRAARTLEELGAALVGAWGVPRLVSERQGWQFLEQVWQYTSAAERRVARSLRYPRFDAAGRFDGWRYTAAIQIEPHSEH